MDGGPSIKAATNLLAASDTPTDDQLAFFRAQILFWLLGATDGHAKNFGIFLRPSGGFKMTPLYDILTAQKAVDDGQIRHNRMRLAMSVGDPNHYGINVVLPCHYLQTAKASGAGIALIEGLLTEITAGLDSAIDKTIAELPADFPIDLVESIENGIRQRSRLLN